MQELNVKMSKIKVSKKPSKKIKINKKKDYICTECEKSITNKLCFCDKLDYYTENIVSIINIQKFIKKQISKIPLYKKLTKKQLLVNEIFKPNKYGVSEWKTRNELSNTNLKLTRNGNCRHGKFFNDTRFIWEKKIEKRMVVALRTNGFDVYNNDNINKRRIRKDIKEHHYKTGCVCCGCKSDLIIDHKNDLYNDPNVLDINKQKMSDFQCLCNHCNLQKRQVCIYTKKNKKRYGATNIPQLKIFGIDFIDGDETFNPDDKDALKGTYWYDPIAFMEHIKKSIIYKTK